MKSGSAEKTSKERILDHIGRYRVSFQAILSERFFEGGDPPESTLRDLIKQNYVKAFTKEIGNISYYQLTPQGAKARGFPLTRAQPLKHAPLDEAVSVLAFCYLGTKRRTRIEETHLQQLFGDERPHQKRSRPYVIELHPEGPERGKPLDRLLQVFVTSTDDVLKPLRQELEKLLAYPTIARWIQQRSYGFAVLTEQPSNADHLRDEIRKAHVQQEIFVAVEAVPSARTIAETLQGDSPRRNPDDAES